MRCPNCGHNSCGCTWDEKLAAMRQTEVSRRQQERDKGNKPVMFDFQTPRSTQVSIV